MSNAMDNRTLEHRLLTNDSVLGGVSVTRCASKLQALRNQPMNKVLIEGFLKDILLLKLDVDKSQYVSQVWRAQSVDYDISETKIRNQINDAKRNILELEQKLSEEVEMRKHRGSCEELAAIINKHPCRSALKRKLDVTTEDLRHTQDMLQSVEMEILDRHKQFNTLLQSIVEMQSDRQHGDKGQSALPMDTDEVDEEEGDGGGERATRQEDAEEALSEVGNKGVLGGDEDDPEEVAECTEGEQEADGESMVVDSAVSEQLNSDAQMCD